MRTYFTVDESSCPTIQGKQPGNLQRHDESKKTPSRFGWIILIVMTLLLLIPTAAVSKKGGNGNGGGQTGGAAANYYYVSLFHICTPFMG